MKEYADLLHENSEYENSFALYKELAETFLDEESMKKIVDMCVQSQGVLRNDRNTLNFILNLIDNTYNEIYLIDRGNIITRTLIFQTRRHHECTWEYLQAKMVQESGSHQK